MVATLPATIISWPVSEILKMTEAGVEDSVILAYIDSFVNPFQLKADDVLYLQDKGVSSEVITAMLRHDAKIEVARKESTGPSASTTQPNETTQYVYDRSLQNQPGEQAGTPASTTEPSYVENPPAQVNYFYQNLAPYGSWIYLEGRGWCWQPDVVATNPNWQPYLDNGRWLNTDDGWYWQSDYSWGWAPFHYGRWWNAPCGWVWFPDTIWAPSWVVWRQFDPFCGWAPLPPFPFPAFFTPGFHFGFGFDFALGADAFFFVRFNDFFRHDLFRHRLHRDEVNNFFGRTTAVNNFERRRDRDDVVRNRGISPEHFSRATGRTIPTVHVSDRSGDPRVSRPDRVTRSGSQWTVARSQLKASANSGSMVAQRVAPNQRVVRHSPTTSNSGSTPRTMPTQRTTTPQTIPWQRPRTQLTPRQTQPAFPSQRSASSYNRRAEVSPQWQAPNRVWADVRPTIPPTISRPMPSQNFHSFTPSTPQHFQAPPHLPSSMPSHASGGGTFGGGSGHHGGGHRGA